MRRGICGGSVDSPAISGVWVAGVAGVRDISGYICVNTNTWSPPDTCHLTISPTDVLQTRGHSICLLSFSFIFTPSTFSRRTFFRAQSAKGGEQSERTPAKSAIKLSPMAGLTYNFACKAVLCGTCD